MMIVDPDEARSDDADIIASKAIEPIYFEAPWPDEGKFIPSPYQHAAVEYRIARRHAVIGDAPGLGKTCEALLFGNTIEAEYTLVVCPASLRLNWKREIAMWTTIENASTYPVLKSGDGISLEHNFVVISYDLLRNRHILEALLDERWDHLILDEAHALKDPKGNGRTKAICGWMDRGTPIDGLIDVVDRVTALTGTLLPNQPIECYNMMRLCDWKSIDEMSLDTFRDTYYKKGGGMIRGPVLIEQDGDGNPCDPFYVNKLHYSADVRSIPVNLLDLQYRLRKNLMVRRLKEDVLTQLPPKRWHLFPIEPNAAMRKVFKHPGWKKAEKLYRLDANAFDLDVPIDGAISTAMRLLGEAKAPTVADYIEELLREGVHKLVVGAWHRNSSPEGVADTGLSVLHYLKKRLKKYGLVYMDGGTSTRNKQGAVDEFQNLWEVRIILGQLSTLGEGWTLTEAQDGVLAEFYWVPGKNDQFLDRMHRRGQEGDYVLGHVPIVPGSLDERVVGTAVKKDKNIYQALDAPL